jgi:SAM-dependent methyltransferase
MTTDRDGQDRAEDLAEQVRRAVAASASEIEPDRDRGAARLWEDAERHVVPTVEPGAPWAAFKRVLLRLLRVLTRVQSTYNVRMLEGSRELERELARLRREVERDRERLAGERRRLEARFAVIEASSGRPAPRPAAAETGRARTGGIPESFYMEFEAEFRGEERSVRERQKVYVDFFRGAPGPVLDCGSGRGEFLELLGEANIPAEGIDANAVAVEIARGRGVSVRRGEALELLAEFEGRAGGVAAIQVVEHMEPDAVFDLIRSAFSALRPGGGFVVETINPNSLYAMKAFHLDPTHRWAVAPETLELMARVAGFEPREIRYLAPVPAGEALDEIDDNARKLNRWIFGPQDYALLARKPA